MIQKRYNLFLLVILIVCMLFSCNIEANKSGYIIKHADIKSNVKKYYALKNGQESGTAIYVWSNRDNAVENIKIACNHCRQQKEKEKLKHYIFPVNNEMQLSLLDDVLSILNSDKNLTSIRSIEIQSCCLGDSDVELLELIKKNTTQIDESLHNLNFYSDLRNILKKYGLHVTEYDVCEVFPTYIKYMETYCIISNKKINMVGANAEIRLNIKFQVSD